MERYFMSSLMIIIFTTLPLAKATYLVSDTCMKIVDSNPDNIKFDFCVKAFESDPRSSNATFKGLIEIAHDLTSIKAKSIVTRINQLQKDPKFDPFAKSALETCSEFYSDGQIDLKEGLDALEGGDFSKANARISAALENGPDCEDTFSEKEGEVSPLTKENTDYVKISRIFLAFTILMKIMN